MNTDAIPDNFKLYKTIHETTKMLDNTQHGILMKAVQGVQFYELHIDSIFFEDNMIQMAWASAKVQIKKQIDGYCSKKKICYDGIFEGATKDPYQGATKDPYQQSKPQPKTESKPKPKPKPKTEVMELSTTLLSGIKVSEYLLSKIIINKSNFKRPNLQTWSKDIDLAIRVDKRTEQELIGCIDWIYTEQGSFWIPNILSAKKLREKFDTMESQMTTKKQQHITNVDKIYDTGLTAQEMIKEMEKRA